jgi:hypothetical protein
MTAAFCVIAFQVLDVRRSCRATSRAIQVGNFDQTANLKERLWISGCRARKGAYVENRSVLAIR